MYNKVTFTTENGHSISHILNEKSTNLVKKSQIWACKNKNKNKNKNKYKWLVWTVLESGWWDGGLLRWDSVDVVRAAPAAGLKWMKTNWEF